MTETRIQLSEVEDTDSDDIQAIALSLKFQLDFLAMCTSMARLNGTVVRNAMPVQQVQELARSPVKLLQKLSKIVKRIEGNKTDSVKALIQRTFDTHVNRPLVGNAPVRTITFRDAKESIALFVTMTKDIDWALCSLMLKGNTFDRIRRMLSTISVSWLAEGPICPSVPANSNANEPKKLARQHSKSIIIHSWLPSANSKVNFPS
jgi:hypothetical protein